MKKWMTPVIDELSINETAHQMFGTESDGGYIGDGELTPGHLKAASGTCADKANDFVDDLWDKIF